MGGTCTLEPPRLQLTEYRLYERGKQKASAWVFADGRCEYNDVACAPDDPLLLALIAQVAPVEVRPAGAGDRRGQIGRAHV